MVFESISYQFEDFFNFLKQRNIINTGIAFVLALQVNKIFLDLVNEIINPLASKIVTKEFNKKQFDVFGLKIRTGLLFLNFINLIFTLIFVYYIWKFSESTPGVISTVYSTISDSLKKLF